MIRYPAGKTDKSYKISDNVIYIEACAFENCSSLLSIEIPKSVSTIGESAFGGCDNLTTVYYSGDKSEWKIIGFQTGNKCLSESTVLYNYVPCEHILTEIPEKIATCTENGNSIYWICSKCNRYFSDKDGVYEIEKDSWITTGHIDENKDGKCDNCSCSIGKLGDVNGDNKINTKDAKVILRVSAKLESITDAEKLLADVNKDGKINTKDAKEILRYSAKFSSVLG